MSERLTILRHAGREVLLSDFSGLQGEELLASMREAIARDATQPDGSLLLTDITGCYVSSEIRELAVDMGQMADRRGFRQAIVGVTGVQKVIFMLVKRNVHLARNRADALAWLTDTR